MKLLSLFFRLKKIWDSWDLRSFLLLSFTFQCILIMTASMRKRTSSRLLLGFICLAYLLADWASYYAIGLIPTNGQERDNYVDLHAFWAPFLLLHLGGPNTIAGFSVEDNELWKRSVLHFFVQAGMTLFIIYRALPRNPLLWPTLLMFVAASTRYLERVLALYYASMEKFRRSVGKDSGTTLKSLKIKKANQRTRQQSNNIEVHMVNDSYILFHTYKGVFGSLPIKFDDNLIQAKQYLIETLSPNEAFNEMEIQMNYAYDIFYTKMWLILEQRIGKILHPISLCCEATSLVLWALTNKYRYRDVDVHLTHTLVVGAVLVHVVSFFKLIFSDLMIPRLTKIRFVSYSYTYVVSKALLIRHHKYGRLLFSRWSGTMSQFNLVKYILEGRHKKPEGNRVIRLIESFIGPKKHGKRVILSEDVKKHVLNHIKYMANYADSQGKSEMICLEIGFYMHKLYNWEELKVILTCAGLVDAMLVCHLATELLYKEDDSYKTNVAKQLSEYLMCLLVDEPRMVGPEGVGIKTIMFEERCEHLKTIYEGEPVHFDNIDEELKKVKSARGDTTMRRSMLKYAHYIKDHLKKLEKQTAKEIIEDIWVELLCHMAIKCNAWAHMEQLSSGGELLTIAWLLMTYVGLTTNFVPQEDDNNSQPPPPP